MIFKIKVGFTQAFLLLLAIGCNDGHKQKLNTINSESLILILDTIFQTEQEPIRMRDSLIKVYGAESKEAQAYHEIYKKNHMVNEEKILSLLDNFGWPKKENIGEQGNLTICNVLQHSDQEIREKYLPLMKSAVLDGQLHPRFLVRAQDRLATDKGDLQVYGGQMKYYPETKSFNLWPVYDPM